MEPAMKSSANQSSMRYETGAAVTPFPTRPVESRQQAPVHEPVPPAIEGTTDENQGGGFTRIEPMKALIAAAVIAVLGVGAWVATRNPMAPTAVGAPAANAAPSDCV